PLKKPMRKSEREIRMFQKEKLSSLSLWLKLDAVRICLTNRLCFSVHAFIRTMCIDLFKICVGVGSFIFLLYLYQNNKSTNLLGIRLRGSDKNV
ncbi:MAG: hypothetical protein PV354_10690, partial [Bartonella sp.]|nr:hypothetical protein [Bartonella sp.]